MKKGARVETYKNVLIVSTAHGVTLVAPNGQRIVWDGRLFFRSLNEAKQVVNAWLKVLLIGLQFLQ